MRHLLTLVGLALVTSSLACSAASTDDGNADGADQQDVISAPPAAGTGGAKGGSDGKPATCVASPAAHATGSPGAKLSTLLEATAANRDYAIATLDRLELGACATRSSLLESSSGSARAVLLSAATDKLGWRDLGDVVQAAPTQDGGVQFSRLLTSTIRDLEERVADGLFDPGATTSLAPLWQERAALASALEGAVTSESALEIVLTTDLEECSERAVARIDLRDGSVIVLRRTPRC